MPLARTNFNQNQTIKSNQYAIHLRIRIEKSPVSVYICIIDHLITRFLTMEQYNLTPVRTATYFYKIVSSIVLMCFCAMTVGRSYAMDNHDTRFASPTKSNAVVPMEYGSPTSVASVIDSPEKKISWGINLFGTTKVQQEPMQSDIELANRAPRMTVNTVVESSPTSSVDSKTEEETKNDSWNIKTILFGEPKNKVQPLEIAPDIENQLPVKGNEVAEIDDNESVNSDDSVDAETLKKREVAIKDFDAYMQDLTKEKMSYRDWALVLLPLIVTGIIAKNEIYGEVRLWVDTVINTYDLTVPGYEFVFINQKSGAIINQLITAVTINDYAALPAYLIYRLSELFTYLGDPTPSHLQTKIGLLPKVVGATGACLAALSAGGSVAAQLYAADMGAGHPAYAKALTPYIFGFYTADAFLRNSLFKDRVLNYMFVKRYDDVETKETRHLLKEKLEASKTVIASMSDEELMTIDLKKVPAGMSPGSDRLVGMDALQNLVDIGKDKTQRRLSVAAHEKKANTHFSVQTFIEKKWPLILGLLLAIGGTYLSYTGARNNFDNAEQMKFPKHFGIPDFSNMGTNSFLQFELAEYNAWLQETRDMPIYNGNGNDWCTRCRDGLRYTSGNITAGGDFIFARCPGVWYQQTASSNPGDWDYTESTCDTWYNMLDAYFANLAGISVHPNADDDYYVVPPQKPLTLSPTGQAFSILAAITLATMGASLAALSTSDAVGRIKDAFSNHPEEILPGKRNKWMNALTLSVSVMQSLIRATPVGVAGWYSMQGTTINQNFMWSVVGLCMLSAATTYVNDFDDAYSKIPNSFRKVYTFTKNNVLKIMGAHYTEEKNPHVLCDELIEQINTVMHVFETAPKSVVEAVNRAVI